VAQYKLDVSEEELAWLQNNSQRYLLKVRATEKNQRVVQALTSLCDKLEGFEDAVLDRNDLRMMQTIAGTMQQSLEQGTIPEYKDRGGHEKYIERAEYKSKMLLTLLEKIDKLL